MNAIMPILIYLPLAAFVLSLFFSRKKEKVISFIATGSILLHFIAITAFTIWWGINGFIAIDQKHITLFETTGFEFFISFYFDQTTAVFAIVGVIIAFMVSIFSRFYMHRDEGFLRFFNILLLFYAGYSFVVLSGNFETFFIGWEIVGITSFLLIAFYRDRYLPVKNGLKVLSLYRLGDVCLVLVMWMLHHVFHRNISFHEIHNGIFSSFSQNNGVVIFISVLIIVAVAIKSAQIPFSSWLPRAMEGPTASSAIFYGSLSVHLGIFLLIRTYPIWENIAAIKILLFAIGGLTALIASSIASVQPTVKTQVAYASVAQIGLMVIEVAAGWHILALIHFAGNAFLRTYQLLVSPSVLNYLIHDMFFSYIPPQKTGVAFSKFRNSIYLLSIKEWNMDFFLRRFVWNPFKWLGRNMGFMELRLMQALFVLVMISGLVSFSYKKDIHVDAHYPLAITFAAVAAAFVLKAFTERGDAIRGWLMAFSSQLFLMLAISFNDHIELKQALMFLSGTVVSGITGLICLHKTKAIDGNISLNQFHGYSYERPLLSLLFLLSCLGMVGFPLTPAFIGIDLLFIHIQSHQIPLVVLAAIGFLVIEISVLRIYCRVFLGQHKKNFHPVAYKSS